MRLKIALVVLSLAAVGLVSCAGSDKGDAGNATETGQDGQELVIYSGRKEELIKPVIEAFEKETGIKVTLHTGDASQLANQIMEEQRNPRADVYIANDAGTLGQLAEKGGLEPYASAATQAVPVELKAEDGSWVGASVRTRVIMYNTNLVAANELPQSVFDLADPKWKGQIGVANSANESMVSHVSAMRLAMGDDFTETFLRNLLANNPLVTKSHSDIRRAVGTGEIKLGLVNHYYYLQQKEEGSPVGVVYPDQGPNGMGTMVNVAGIGVVKGVKNQEAAGRFIDFVLSVRAQEIFAGANKELPVIGISRTVDAPALGTFKQAYVPLSLLGDEIGRTMDMMERAGI